MFPSEAGTTDFVPDSAPSRPPPLTAPVPVEERAALAQSMAIADGGVRSTPPLAEDGPVELPVAPSPAVTEPMLSVADSSLSGAWTLETRIESSSLRMFEGLRLGYRLELRQNGSQVEGTGCRISENGVSLSGRRRTPIVVQGTIEGGRLKLTFGEQGSRRHSNGTFNLVLEDAGLLRGSFASGAARSARPRQSSPSLAQISFHRKKCRDDRIRILRAAVWWGSRARGTPP